MTGMGIVALAGIVVRNGILLVEFTDVMLERGANLKDAIIGAAKTRITPVVLTSTATILGLVPLAVGFNIDFVSLFQDLNPKIHFGGDSVTFFGSLAWTITFGLAFAMAINSDSDAGDLSGVVTNTIENLAINESGTKSRSVS